MRLSMLSDLLLAEFLHKLFHLKCKFSVIFGGLYE